VPWKTKSPMDLRREFIKRLTISARLPASTPAARAPIFRGGAATHDLIPRMLQPRRALSAGSHGCADDLDGDGRLAARWWPAEGRRASGRPPTATPDLIPRMLHRRRVAVGARETGGQAPAALGPQARRVDAGGARAARGAESTRRRPAGGSGLQPDPRRARTRGGLPRVVPRSCALRGLNPTPLAQSPFSETGPIPVPTRSLSNV
jgi:hypothetical protein